MKRQKIFISYASADGYFVPLVGKLLEIHNHEPWFAQANLRGGDLIEQKIREELTSSDVLIVVVSEHAASSTWVATEIATFKTANAEGTVIPVRLGRVDSNTISPGLASHHEIDFTEDLLAGFQELLAALGNDFLSRKELANRRSGGERRRGADRRKMGVEHRISIGLLVAYTRLTGKPVIDNNPLSPGDIAVLQDPAKVELERYTYHDTLTAREVPAETVLDQAFDHTRGRVKARGQMHAVAVMNTVASYICETYDVRMIDRRAQKRRRDDPPAGG